MKNKKRVLNLIPLLVIIISIMCLGLTAIPSEKSSAYAAGCGVWGSLQLDKTEQYGNECWIYTDGDWYFDVLLRDCIYSPGESCKVVTCKSIPTCWEIFPG